MISAPRRSIARRRLSSAPDRIMPVVRAMPEISNAHRSTTKLRKEFPAMFRRARRIRFISQSDPACFRKRPDRDLPASTRPTRPAPKVTAPLKIIVGFISMLHNISSPAQTPIR